MHDSRESGQRSLTKVDEIIQSIFTHFPNARILTPEEAVKFKSSHFKLPTSLELIKRPARKGAGREPASAGKQRQDPTQETLFDLSLYGGKE